MWKTSQYYLTCGRCGKLIHHKCGKLIRPPVRCLKGEYFEKDEKKVPGYPQRVWITKGKSVQKRNDSPDLPESRYRDRECLAGISGLSEEVIHPQDFANTESGGNSIASSVGSITRECAPNHAQNAFA